MTTDALAERLRRRAMARLVPALGPQWVLVTDGLPPSLPPDERAPRVVVLTGVGAATGSTAGSTRGAVRGAAHAIPVLSEAATGVLVHAPGGLAQPARVAAEVRRLLQPGGVAAFLSVWSATDAEAFDAVLTAAGLSPLRRVAIRRTDCAAPALAETFPFVEERRAAAAQGAETVECAIVGRRTGGTDAELPTGASVLSSMFVPRFGRRFGLR